jgi:hypothetical protein
VHDVFDAPPEESTGVKSGFLEGQLESYYQLQLMASFPNKMVHQSILVSLYALLWTNDFLVDGSAGEGRLIRPQV